jgi:hypothetical protein
MCPNCGREVHEAQPFCACGEYLHWELVGSLPDISNSNPDDTSVDLESTKTEHRVCPTCNYRNSPENHFCNECEEYLRWELTGSIPRVRESIK